MRSLFLLSLPRSLSTLTYHAARIALDLEQPEWTTDGEILNLDRFTPAPGATREAGSKFTRREASPALFDELCRFLDRATAQHGFAYKDVVHPFVASAWAPASGLAVLKLYRDPEEVAASMLARSWHYPASVAERSGELLPRIIEGLQRAWDAIAAVPGPTIHYDALIYDERVLTDALRRLYPGERVCDVAFIDEDFQAGRDRQLNQRKRRGETRHIEP